MKISKYFSLILLTHICVFLPKISEAINADFIIKEGYTTGLNYENTIGNQSNNSSYVSFLWYKDGIKFSEKINPGAVTFGTFGEHTITLVVYNSNKDTARKTHTINVVKPGGFIQAQNAFPIKDVEDKVAFSAGNQLFLGLGQDDDMIFNSFYRYDYEQDYWEFVTDFPDTSMKDMAAFTINDEGYIGLGRGYDNTFTSKRFWKYNAQTDTWKRIADYPGDPRYKACVMVINNKAYVGDGIGSGNTNDFWEYDPTTDSWKQVASIPSSLYNDQNVTYSFVVKNRGYIFNSANTYEYLPAQDSWATRATINTPVGSQAIITSFGTTQRGYVYAKGYVNSEAAYYYYSYDTDSNTWRRELKQGPPGYVTLAPFPRFSVIINEHTFFPNTGSFSEYDPNYQAVEARYVMSPNFDNDQYVRTIWTESNINIKDFRSIQPYNQLKILLDDVEFIDLDTAGYPIKVPHTRLGQQKVSLIAYNDTLGLSDTSVLYYTVVRDVCKGKWLNTRAMPGINKAYGASFVIDTFAYAGVGGWCDICPVYKDFYRYDIVNNTWQKIADYPGDGVKHAISFAIGGYGYVGLGEPKKSSIVDSLNSDFYRYDPATNTWTEMARFPGNPPIYAGLRVINNKAYLFCGYVGNPYNLWGKESDEVWEYDPATNKWTQKASYPGQPNYYPIVYVNGDDVYVKINGSQYESKPKKHSSKLWKYSIQNDTWTDARNRVDCIPVGEYSRYYQLDSVYAALGTNFQYTPYAYDEEYCQWNFVQGSSEINPAPGETSLHVPEFTTFSYKNKIYIVLPNKSFGPNGNRTIVFDLDYCELNPYGNLIDTSTKKAITAAINICPGDSAFLTAGEEKWGVTYTWLNNGTGIPNADRHFYYAKDTGSYQLRIFYGTDSFTSQTIQVTHLPAPPKPQVDINKTYLITSGNNNIKWYFNDELIALEDDSVYTPSKLGTYKVSHTNSLGCTTFSDTFSFDPSWLAKIIDINDYSIIDTVWKCKEDIVRLQTAPTIPADSYTWEYNNALITNADKYYLDVKDTGDYQLFIVYDSINYESQKVRVNNHTNPLKPTIAKSGDTLYTSSADSIQWYFNSNPISNANDSFHVVLDSGVYEVEHFNIYGCANKSDTVHAKPLINSILDVLEEGKTITVYPNPFTNQIVLELQTGIIREARVKVLSTSGVFIFDKEVVLDNGEATIDLSGSYIANGIYIVQVWIEGRLFNFKLAKQ